MSGLPQIVGLGILDADGRRLNQARDRPNLDDDRSGREYFRALKENPKLPSYVGKPLRGTLSGAWIIMQSRPVLGPDGAFLGVVFASTEMRYFEDLFRATSLGDGYTASMLRDDGTLMARYPTVGQIGSVFPSAILQTLTNSRSGVTHTHEPG